MFVGECRVIVGALTETLKLTVDSCLLSNVSFAYKYNVWAPFVVLNVVFAQF